MPIKHCVFEMADFITHSLFLANSIRTALASLAQHKLRSFLSILGIVCGVTAVLTILAIGEGAQVETLRHIEQIGIRNIYVKADTLTPAQLSRAQQYHSRGLQLDDLLRLQAVIPAIRRSAAVREWAVDPSGFPEHLIPQVVETTASYSTVLGLSMSSGRFLVPRDITGNHRVCVLGWDVSAALGGEGKPGGVLRLGSELWKVVGVIHRRDIIETENSRISMQNINNMIMVPIGVAPGSTSGDQVPVSELIVEIDEIERVARSGKMIKRTLRVAHGGIDDFSLVVPLELLAQSRRIQRIFNLVFGSLGGLSLVIGGIGVMNIMLASVSERVREIGLRRAVGAQPYHIVAQFITEAVMLTGLGGFVGTVVGISLALSISAIAGWPVYFSAPIVLLPLGISVVTGGFFGIYPAFMASRMDPLKALGYSV